MKPLPCPFCGSKKASVCMASAYRHFTVKCDKCEATCGSTHRVFDSIENDSLRAIEVWNRRADSAPEQQI